VEGHELSDQRAPLRSEKLASGRLCGSAPNVGSSVDSVDSLQKLLGAREARPVVRDGTQKHSRGRLCDLQRIVSSTTSGRAEGDYAGLWTVRVYAPGETIDACVS